MGKEIRTEIKEVTVFRDRALVKRSGVLPHEYFPEKEAEQASFVITPLPLSLDDSSVRLSIHSSDGVILRDIRIDTVNIRGNEGKFEEKRTELEKLRRRQRSLREGRTVKAAVVSELKSYLNASLPDNPLVEGRKAEKPSFPAEAYLSYCKEIVTRLDEEQKNLRLIEEELIKLDREYRAREQSLNEAERYWRENKHARWKKQILFQIERKTGDLSKFPVEISATYVIPGARWSPFYTLQVQQKENKVALELAMKVAQNTGEDWAGVNLSFSAAPLHRQSQLPPLPSKRIGRSQPSPRPALRQAQEMNKELLASYVSWQRLYPAPQVESLYQRNPVFFARAESLISEGHSLVGTEERNVPLPRKTVQRRVAPPPPPSAPVMQQMARERADRMDDDIVFADLPECEPTGAEEEMDMDTFVERSPQPKKMAKESIRLASAPSAVSGFMKVPYPESILEREEDDDSLVLSSNISPVILPENTDFRLFELNGPEDSGAGLLRKRGMYAEKPGLQDAYTGAMRALSQLQETGLMVESSFFHLFESTGEVNIPSDGAVYTVTISKAEADSVFSYRTAPIIEPLVFKRLTLSNPFPFPLPRGAVAVYNDGAYAFTTTLEMATRQGQAFVAMGVEERIKVSRNVRYVENEGGLISSVNELNHAITVELKSHLPKTVDVEIVDRIPVTDKGNKVIEIEPLPSQPAGEKISTYENKALRGGVKFKLSCPSGEKVTCKFGYKITIPAKKELINGNRRG